MKTDHLITIVILLLTFCFACSSEPGVEVPKEEKPVQPVLSVSPAQAIIAAATGGNFVISVTTNQTSWSANADKEWCKITDKTAGNFKIAVDPNASTTTRDATVTVTAWEAPPVKISLSQQGAAPSLSLSPEAGTIVFSAAAKEAPFTYTVITNVTAWEVKVTPAEATWCKVTKDAVNNRFSVVADTNPFSSARGPATVTVTAGSVTPLQIIVNQRANTSQKSEDFGYGEDGKWD